jgi:Na+/H+-dicarboxylate symporter
VRGIPLYLQILIGVLAGAALGIALGPQASPLGQLGRLIIQLIKTFAVPLLFLAILDGFLTTPIGMRSAGKLIGISAMNAVFALVIGLGISNLLRPGDYLSAPGLIAQAAKSPVPAAEKLDVLKVIAGYIPSDLVKPFAENSVMTIIGLAILLGAALRKVKSHQQQENRDDYLAIERCIRTLLDATRLILIWVIRLVPFAVFGVVAKIVGEQGLAPIRGLAVYVGVALLGLLIQILVVYQGWIHLVAKRSLRWFWKGARDPVVYALGASSSLATLPVTLKSLDAMEVSPQSARLAACVGTNLNHDGIFLYEAMAALYVAQAHGVHLSFGHQLAVAGTSLVAGIGIAGIPDAGLVSLSLVLTSAGLPLDLLPLLLTVDWILSRGRAITNVISDMSVAVMLDS